MVPSRSNIQKQKKSAGEPVPTKRNTPMKTAFIIRDAGDGDLTAISDIYAHHVHHGLASFEEEAPGVEEMTRRYSYLRNKDMPYFVAEDDGRILGYAYAGPYRERIAYRYTVENSVYVAPDALGRGVGGALMDTLIPACTERGYRQMVSVIGDSANRASIALHESRGFRMVGTLEATGFKFSRWVDSVFMQLPLGEGSNSLPG